MGVMLSVYQNGRAETAAVFKDAPAVPRCGDWFRFTGADGRKFKGQVVHVEWMAYVADRQTKMTVGIFLDQLSILP